MHTHLHPPTPTGSTGSNSYAHWEPCIAKLVRLSEAKFFDAPDVPEKLRLVQEWLRQAKEVTGTEARLALSSEAPDILCSLQQRLRQQATDEARMETESPSVPDMRVELKSTRLFEAAEMLAAFYEALMGMRPDALPSEVGTPRKS